MPSLKSKLLYGALKSVKPLLTGVDIPKQRKGMDLLRYVYALPKSVELRKAEGGIRGEWAIPADAVPDKVILYSHGGLYFGIAVHTRADHLPVCRAEPYTGFRLSLPTGTGKPVSGSSGGCQGGGDLFTGAGLCTAGYGILRGFGWRRTDAFTDDGTAR